MDPTAAPFAPKSASVPSTPIPPSPQGATSDRRARSTTSPNGNRLSKEQAQSVDDYKRSQHHFFTALFALIGKEYSQECGIHDLIAGANQVALLGIFVPPQLLIELEKSVVGRKLAKTYYQQRQTNNEQHDYVIDKFDQIITMLQLQPAGISNPEQVLCGQGCMRCHRPSYKRSQTHGSSSSFSSSSSSSPSSPRKPGTSRRCDVDNWRRRD